MARPRDSTIDVRALTAARELLELKGFTATTVQAVAERSGVHTSAIYRRWPSRLELIEAAAFPGFDPAEVRPTGDLARDLDRLLRAYLRAFDRPAARAAAGPLMAMRRDHPPTPYLGVSARPQFRALLRAAPPGAVDPGVDADDVFDLLLGAILTRTLAHPVTARRRPIARTVELLLRVLTPR